VLGSQLPIGELVFALLQRRKQSCLRDLPGASQLECESQDLNSGPKTLLGARVNFSFILPFLCHY
jgi:hypothetical protein